MLKILDFTQFFKHFVFLPYGYGGLKKVQKRYIDVNVCFDVDCVDKK